MVRKYCKPGDPGCIWKIRTDPSSLATEITTPPSAAPPVAPGDVKALPKYQQGMCHGHDHHCHSVLSCSACSMRVCVSAATIPAEHVPPPLPRHPQPLCLQPKQMQEMLPEYQRHHCHVILCRTTHSTQCLETLPEHWHRHCHATPCRSTCSTMNLVLPEYCQSISTARAGSDLEKYDASNFCRLFPIPIPSPSQLLCCPAERPVLLHLRELQPWVG